MALNLSVAGASRPNCRFEFVEYIDVDVYVHHPAKSNADKALYRGMGSIDFAAACRSVLLAGHDVDDTQEKGARINLVQPRTHYGAGRLSYRDTNVSTGK